MNFVQPIRDPELIREIKRYLKRRSDRDFILFLFGINTGLRISDILSLKIKDVKKPYINIRETKTSKEKRINLPPELKRELARFIEEKEDYEYLFKSRKGINRPITRSTAYRILKDAAHHVKLDSIGTHSMRKTFGYHFYKSYKDVALLQDIFNHSAPSVTLRYIGINQDSIDDAMKGFRI